MSNGMIMCASTADKATIELVRPPNGSKIGERVQLSDKQLVGELSQTLEATLNPKKKIEPKFLEQLKINEKGEATYNGLTLEAALGVLKADTLTNVSIS